MKRKKNVKFKLYLVSCPLACNVVVQKFLKPGMESPLEAERVWGSVKNIEKEG